NIQALSNIMIPGKSFLITNGLIGLVRGIITGGSSIFYYGTAFDPPQEMFKSYGIDISEEIKEVRTELPIAPLSDKLMGPGAKRIMESAQELGYAWNKLPKFIDQEKCEAQCWKCTWGCPTGAKWSARMFVEEAAQNGAELVNGARVRKVIVENGKAIGVEYTKRGFTQKVFAPKVILSAGGIGSPGILRESGINLAGYDFFFDPLIAVMGTVKGLKAGKEIPMASGVHMVDEGYLMTDMAMPRSLHMIMAAEVFKFNRLFSNGKSLKIMVKIKDGLGGRLTDKGGVRKGLSEADKQKLRRGGARAKDILQNAGAKNIFKSWYLAAHPGGTAKINDVVDSNLMTELENLYVCDCSVVPEAWGLPPTFSLLCLGKRLAKHLSGEKNAGATKSIRSRGLITEPN
ncbi:GMC family oxidoreductase N-terminal domain-containing protein, partial [bacterium]|nr:GMC family oxidoreductase N-terminal domain-containing protein [bacterium]